MKSNNASNLRSQNARNEARDENGRFTSEHKSSSKTTGSHRGGQGSYAKTGPRNSQGELEPEQGRKSSHSSSQSKSSGMNSHGNHRGENAKNEPRDSQGRFESKK